MYILIYIKETHIFWDYREFAEKIDIFHNQNHKHYFQKSALIRVKHMIMIAYQISNQCKACYKILEKTNTNTHYRPIIWKL